MGARCHCFHVLVDKQLFYRGHLGSVNLSPSSVEWGSTSASVSSSGTAIVVASQPPGVGPFNTTESQSHHSVDLVTTIAQAPPAHTIRLAEPFALEAPIVLATLVVCAGLALWMRWLPLPHWLRAYGHPLRPDGHLRTGAA